jgi:hypothetical protein
MPLIKKWTRFFSGIAILLSFLYLYVPVLRAASTPKYKKPAVASKKPLNAPRKANVPLKSVEAEDVEENEEDENSSDPYLYVPVLRAPSTPKYKKPVVVPKKPLNAPRKANVPLKSVGAEDVEENEEDENSLDASFESETDDAADEQATMDEDDGDDEQDDEEDDEENDVEEEEDSGDYDPGF